jgi:hypothetical protein
LGGGLARWFWLGFSPGEDFYEKEEAFSIYNRVA